MFGDDRGTSGFVLSLGAAVIAAIVLHMVLTRQPPAVDDAVSQPEPPATASVGYRSLGTRPGHRLPCNGPGATARGPRSTVPVADVDSCRMIAPPERVTVEVLFDVTPQGLPANVMIEGSIPCLDPVIEEALRGFTYCPKKVRGEPAWRYGERAQFSFVRYP